MKITYVTNVRNLLDVTVNYWGILNQLMKESRILLAISVLMLQLLNKTSHNISKLYMKGWKIINVTSVMQLSVRSLILLFTSRMSMRRSSLIFVTYVGKDFQTAQGNSKNVCTMQISQDVFFYFVNDRWLCNRFIELALNFQKMSIFFYFE